MKQLLTWLFKLFLLVITFGVFHACSPEKKLAKSFVYSETKRNVLLLGPDMVFKTSLKTDILDSLEITNESLFDSVLFANSDFLQHLDDVLFIQNFILGLENELRLFNFEIYKEPQTSDFLEVDSNAFVLYVAQIELEEAYYPFKDETVYMDSYYFHEHILNSASVYSWFEISEVNKKRDRNVYFAEDAVVDEIDGEFTLDYFGGQVKYFYQIDSLITDDLYKYAYDLGRKYAGYTFDLLLNNYIIENMDYKPKYYLRYDPNFKNFFEATDDKFILLDE